MWEGFGHGEPLHGCAKQGEVVMWGRAAELSLAQEGAV